jgi:hypothetical protein
MHSGAKGKGHDSKLRLAKRKVAEASYHKSAKKAKAKEEYSPVL